MINRFDVGDPVRVDILDENDPDQYYSWEWTPEKSGEILE